MAAADPQPPPFERRFAGARAAEPGVRPIEMENSSENVTDGELPSLWAEGSADALSELCRMDTPESLVVLRELFKRGPARMDFDNPILEYKDEKGALAARKFLNRVRLRLLLCLALARRGDSDCLNELLSGLEAKEGEIFELSIGLLGRTGRQQLAARLAPFLFKFGTPFRKSKSHCVIHRCYSEMAAESLSRLFPEVKSEFKAKNSKSYYHIDEWKAWWNANAGRFGAS